jgi:hypothetical protein
VFGNGRISVTELPYQTKLIDVACAEGTLIRGDLNIPSQN